MSLNKLRLIALSTLGVIVAVAVSGIPQLQLNSHYSAYFDSDDPLLVSHRQISEMYSRPDAIFVVLQAAESFLDTANYRLLEQLTDTLAAQQHVDRALSITELGILGDTPSGDGEHIPSFEQLQRQGRAIGLLLDESKKLAGILVQVRLPDNHSESVVAAVREVRAAVEAAIADRPVSAHYTGTLALNDAYIEVVQHDLGRIMPLLFIVTMIMLALLMRSGRTLLVMLPVGVFSVVAAFGVIGLLGAELAAINAFTPVIIFTISVAGCVHVTLAYTRFRDASLTTREAALSAIRLNLLPMALANGTTAVGFLGLAFSPSPPIRVMGYLVAVGIFVSFVLCVSLLPTALARIDPWKPAAERGFGFLDQLSQLVVRRRSMLIVVTLLLALPAAWLASRNVVSDNVFEYFSPAHSFSRDTRLVDRQLGGVNEIIYSVESGRAFDYFDAGAIEAVGQFSAWLRQQSEVKRVTSVADIDVLVEASNEGRLQQRLDFYRTRMGASAESNPLLALGVSDDFSSSAVSAYLKPLDSRALVEFDRRVLLWAEDNLTNYSVRSGGPTLMFAHLGQQNIRGMLAALTIALLAASVVLGVVFRSIHVAWIALVCNALPVLIAYSVWAMVDGQISIGAAVVMGMIMGIVLDDTIYLLASWQQAVRRRITHAVQHAVRYVGPALIVTTVALVSGLSIGMLSDFGPIWSMSALSAGIIGIALLVDLLLLPALLPVAATRGDFR